MKRKQQGALERFVGFVVIAAMVLVLVVAAASGSGGQKVTPAPRESDPAAELAKDTPLRKAMIRAAEHLPAGASLEEVTAQAQAEEATTQIAEGEAQAAKEIAAEEARGERSLPGKPTAQEEREGREWQAAHPDGEP